MSYNLIYLDDSNIVRVAVTGRLNFGMVQQYLKEALKLAHENNCTKYLLDHTETLRETDAFKLHTDGDTLEKFGFKSNDKIAVVISDDPSVDQSLQAEKSNVKWSNTRYFKSVDGAMKWLEEEG
jgi:hypothetical protein